MLDKCASVDEAIRLLSSYDMHSDLGGKHYGEGSPDERFATIEQSLGKGTVTEKVYTFKASDLK